MSMEWFRLFLTFKFDLKTVLYPAFLNTLRNLGDNSSLTLDQNFSYKSLLNLGPKFVPTTKSLPYLDIVSITESSALKLEYNKKDEAAQTLRREVLRELKLNKNNKNDNLTRQQRKALTQLKKDKNIDIYPFDKGIGFVTIPHDKAIKKIREQIGLTKITNEDPTQSYAMKIKVQLSKLNKKGRFTKDEYQQIYPSDPISPCMYGVVKAHKPEKSYPMRIVVSTIDTPNYGISNYLVKLIQPILNENPTQLKNSQQFVEKAKSWDISSDEIQISLDVINLYPSIPLKEATEVLISILEVSDNFKKMTKLNIKEIKTLIELCLYRPYFLWNNEIHELENSGPIGLSVMVVLAESFLQNLEKRALNIALKTNPIIDIKAFYRYVDDSHARVPNIAQANQFKTILNQQHPKIQYTIEFENDKKTINFLDLCIINNKNGKYEFRIHRKNAITNIQVKATSNHDPQILNGIFKGFVHRAFNVCSQKHIENELKFFIQVFVENGYKYSNLIKIIKEIKRKYKKPLVTTKNIDNITSTNPTISLPWVPILSPKLRKVFRKAGYKTVFKSNSNLEAILTSRNKSKLQRNRSLPY
ncbi:uncharacterized protein LOC136093634 [Hydra vulgaris]|uniref:uncharacterized protein LOC136093634 n=1 Tax=Hydra vulgaris TaxID=6087 RepID=UPI0032EA6F83